jgi:hypothetical protein
VGVIILILQMREVVTREENVSVYIGGRAWTGKIVCDSYSLLHQ